MSVFAGVVFVALAFLSLLGVRWAYVAFIVLGLLYFPIKVGFHVHPQACEVALDVPLAIFSLNNRAHIVMFAGFFILTIAQLNDVSLSSLTWAGLAAVAMGMLVEIAEGITGVGHCRVRDLVPDSAGAALGAIGVVAWTRVRRTLWR
jgi:hypothetical protein